MSSSSSGSGSGSSISIIVINIAVICLFSTVDTSFKIYRIILLILKTKKNSCAFT